MKPLLILTEGNLHLCPSHHPSPNGICIINKETQPRFILFRGDMIESFLNCCSYRTSLLKMGYQNTSIIMFCDN